MTDKRKKTKKGATTAKRKSKPKTKTKTIPKKEVIKVEEPVTAIPEVEEAVLEVIEITEVTDVKIVTMPRPTPAQLPPAPLLPLSDERRRLYSQGY